MNDGKNNSSFIYSKNIAANVSAFLKRFFLHKAKSFLNFNWYRINALTTVYKLHEKFGLKRVGIYPPPLSMMKKNYGTIQKFIF